MNYLGTHWLPLVHFIPNPGSLRAEPSGPRSDPEHPSDPLHPKPFVCGASPVGSGGYVVQTLITARPSGATAAAHAAAATETGCAAR